MAAHLFSERGAKLPPPLRQAVNFKQVGAPRPRLLPVLITGSREPLSTALLRALRRELVDACGRGRPPAVIEKLRVALEAGAELTDEAVLSLTAEANAYVTSSGKATGLLIILDELGKFLEYAALHPERQDVFVLQRLAEAAARSGRTPLFVVGLLHQGFSAYADHLSQSAQREWEKIAGRFDELLFDQPLEQTAGLVGDALNLRLDALPKATVKAARAAMEATVRLGWYGAPAVKENLLANAARLYPLHRLRSQKKSAATVAFKLSVIRSLFEYLKAAGVVPLNPASTKLVSPPELSSEPAGRALSAKEVRYLLSGPDREKPDGARDYALMLVMLRLSLRVSEVSSLRVSSVKWSHGRWALRCKVKGGREEVWPLPKDIKEAFDNYLRLDRKRREIVHSGGDGAPLFQPHTNYRTLDFDKPLSTRMVQKIVKKWADYSRLGDLSPHDLRRTAITRALDSRLSYRQVQMMSKHKDPKTVMRYDHGRENLDQNAVNFLGYDEE